MYQLYQSACNANWNWSQHTRVASGRMSTHVCQWHRNTFYFGGGSEGGGGGGGGGGIALLAPMVATPMYTQYVCDGVPHQPGLNGPQQIQFTLLSCMHPIVACPMRDWDLRQREVVEQGVTAKRAAMTIDTLSMLNGRWWSSFLSNKRVHGQNVLLLYFILIGPLFPWVSILLTQRSNESLQLYIHTECGSDAMYGSCANGAKFVSYSIERLSILTWS